MVKRTVPSELTEAICPACGAAIKTAPTARRRRVQCPKCRDVVVIDGTEEKDPEIPTRTVETVMTIPPEVHGRIESLESRVEALETLLYDALTAARTPGNGAEPPKMFWVAAMPGQPPAFSPEQDQALFHNLQGVRAQPIAIRIPAGDLIARSHAEWFKSVFERAGWTVYGPEEIRTRRPVAALSLAVPDLPVGKDAAATYLALKAAGFEANPMLDPESRGTPTEGAPTMALTLPAGRVA